MIACTTTKYPKEEAFSTSDHEKSKVKDPRAEPERGS